MKNATRMAKSFTIDREIDKYVAKTKGARSASERVNEMLTLAMKQERYSQLEAEAQSFFATVKDDERKEARAFQAAAIRAISRD